MIRVYQPYLPPDMFSYAKEAFESTWISSQGKFLTMAEEALAKFHGKPTIATCNGSAAVHLAARALKKRFPNITNIICPDNVFIAAISGFLYDNNYQMITCPSNINTWNYDLIKLNELLGRLNPATTACLIVSNIGSVTNVPKLKRDHPKWVFIEDNCEGFSGTYEGCPTGTAGFCSAISFYGNKTVSSGEGGAIILSDEDMYNYVYCLHNTGQSSTRFIHNELGYNYRLTNVQSAILLKQLEYLPKIKEMKAFIFDKYKTNLNIDGITIQQTEDNTEHSNWMFGFRVDSSLSKGFQHANDFFAAKNIEIRPMFYSIADHKFISDYPVTISNDSVAREINRTAIILPSYPELTSEDQDHIISVVTEYIKKLKEL